MEQWQIEHLTDEALDALKAGQPERALSITDQLVEEAPDDAVVRTIRAKALLQTGSVDEAMDESRAATELAPESVEAHVVLGLAAWQVGRLTWAQEAMQRAIDLSGRRPGVLTDYAWFMASERGPKLAEEAAREAVEAAPESSTAYAALGLAQLRLHRRGEAEESLKRALKLDPNDPYAQSVMVTLLQDKRQDSRALALARLLEDTPGTEQFVDTVRAEAKKRQLARVMVEREAYPTPFRETPSRRWLAWLKTIIGLSFAIAVLWFLFRPETLPGKAFCIATPLYIYWRVRAWWR
jgi:Tfp pilus assembly protein PilF